MWNGGINWNRIIDSPQVVHWWAENKDVVHPKLSALPTGLCDDNPDNTTEFPGSPCPLPLALALVLVPVPCPLSLVLALSLALALVLALIPSPSPVISPTLPYPSPNTNPMLSLLPYHNYSNPYPTLTPT